MKISSKNEKGSIFGKGKSHSSSTKVEDSSNVGENGSFVVQLFNSQRISKTQAEEKDLHELISSLETVGNRLTQQSRLDDFYLYRNLVKSILQKTFPNTFFLEKILDRPSFRKPIAKEHKVVQLVNQELNSLFTLIKEEHKNALKITSKVLEIKGLLFNLIT